MGWVIIVEDLAQIDIDEAFIWYEEQAQDLGYRFIQELDDTIGRITKNPFSASAIEADIRSASLQKFPYAVIYLIREGEQVVFVLAVSHHSRRPGWFRNRL